MQQWRFGRVMSSLIAVLFLAVSLAMIGCGDDDDGDGGDNIAQAQALENKTIAFDAGAIDARLAGLPAVLTFGNSDQNTLPFTLALAGNTIVGTATVDSIDFLPRTITNAEGASVQTVTINNVLFGVNVLFTIDIVIDPSTGVVTITNPDGTTNVLDPDPEGAVLLANRTLREFDLHVIDDRLANELATLVFTAAIDNALDFTLTHPEATISGQAILFENRIAFVIESIGVGGQVIRQILINGVTISLGGILLNIDFDIDQPIGGFTVTFTNPDTGNFNRYSFSPGQSEATGTTGSSGSDGD